MMPPSALNDAITEIRSQVGAAAKFNINLFVVDDSPELPKSLPGWAAPGWLERYCSDQGYISPPPLSAPFAPKFTEQFEVLLRNRPPIASFTFGILPQTQIERCKAAGIEVWGTATSIDEARQWAKNGADAVVLQGYEAGGHQGSFHSGDEPSTTELEKLFDQCMEHLNLPLIVAGGITSGAEIMRYTSMGARAAQIGTLFLGATDSGIAEPYYRALYSGHGTSLTRSFTGRWARGIRNKFMEATKELPVLPYPAQNRLTQPLRKQASLRGDVDHMSLWAGINVDMCRKKPIKEIIDELESEMREFDIEAQTHVAKAN